VYVCVCVFSVCSLVRVYVCVCMYARVYLYLFVWACVSKAATNASVLELCVCV